jgi:hypothetical protein
VIDAAAGERWRAIVEDRHRRGELFGAVGYYLFTATVPG